MYFGVHHIKNGRFNSQRYHLIKKYFKCNMVYISVFSFILVVHYMHANTMQMMLIFVNDWYVLVSSLLKQESGRSFTHTDNFCNSIFETNAISTHFAFFCVSPCEFFRIFPLSFHLVSEYFLYYKTLFYCFARFFALHLTINWDVIFHT